jgi:hypothetical protein
LEISWPELSLPTVKLIFRDAAHIEEDTGPVLITHNSHASIELAIIDTLRRFLIKVDPGSLSNPRNFRGFDLTEKPRIKPLGFFLCFPRVLAILVLPAAKQRTLSFRPKIAFPRPERAISSATLRFSV